MTMKPPPGAGEAVYPDGRMGTSSDPKPTKAEQEAADVAELLEPGRARAVGEGLGIPRIEPMFDPVQELIDEAEIQARDWSEDDGSIVDAVELQRRYAKLDHWHTKNAAETQELIGRAGRQDRRISELEGSLARAADTIVSAHESPPSFTGLVGAFAEGLLTLALRRRRR